MPSEENQNNDSEDSSKPKKRAAKKSPGRPKKKQAFKKSSDLAKLYALLDEDPSILEYRQNVKAVTNKIYEHLNCFILIGYTENGDPVQITTAKNPKDYDALSTGLQKYVFDAMPKNPPGTSM